MMWVGFYIVAIGVGLWRFIKFTDARTWIVARPAVVIVLRIAANAIRYVEGSSNNSDMRRIIVEQVSARPTPKDHRVRS